MIQEDVQFARLGLVVIERAAPVRGVRQRAMLKQAGPDPHYLVMTATPIPRTVTMTLFGDLDVSTLRESPPGRQTIHTYLAEVLASLKTSFGGFVDIGVIDGHGRQVAYIGPYDLLGPRLQRARRGSRGP